jgi:hypothetical protein
MDLPQLALQIHNKNDSGPILSSGSEDTIMALLKFFVLAISCN